MTDKKKLTQAELLELLSPPPFNQKPGPQNEEWKEPIGFRLGTAPTQ